jgi:hypothetical protein
MGIDRVDSPTLGPAHNGASSAPSPSRLEIELGERTGRLLVEDSRLFSPSGRSFARRLVEALCLCRGVRSAGVEIESSTCWVDFDLASTDPEIMARIFVEALATSAGPTRQRWWPTRNPRWSSFVAYRHLDRVSCWEIQTEPPGPLRLVRRGPSGGRAAAACLADAVSGLDDLQGCHVSPWSRRITVDLRPCDMAKVRRALGRLELILEGRCPAGRLPAGTAPLGSVPRTVVGSTCRWKRIGLFAAIVVAMVLLSPLGVIVLSAS